MAHIDDELKPRSLTDYIIENQILFNVISVLFLIPVVLALLLWGLVRFFRAALPVGYSSVRISSHSRRIA
jgi:hypothetical protein